MGQDLLSKRGKEQEVIIDSQLASPGQGHIVDSFGNVTNEKGKVKCHLASASQVDIDGNELPC